MTEESYRLDELVATIVEPLIDDPDSLAVSSSMDEPRHMLIEVRVSPDDIGKVIGRQGRIIKSIRTVARAAASRQDLGVDVELIDQ